VAKDAVSGRHGDFHARPAGTIYPGVYSRRTMASPKKAVPRPASKPARKGPAKPPAKAAARAAKPSKSKSIPQRTDPALFAPLCPGEVADAIRTLTEDRRVSSMAKVGRYRVLATEPLVVKPPHWMSGHRLARVVVYDYAADRCVDACVDLDAGVVAHLDITLAQPMLSRDEELAAAGIALQDEGVRATLQIGDEPQVTLHYWGRNAADLAYSRRSAAVVFGRPGAHPSVVAIVDLLDGAVTQVVPAAQW